METGISSNEACANNAIGTKEDFERLCNPDGTLKKQTDTTTFSLKGTDNTITVSNIYIQAGGVALAIIAIVSIVLIVRRVKRKTT